jgi:hypothetical protein
MLLNIFLIYDIRNLTSVTVMWNSGTVVTASEVRDWLQTDRMTKLLQEFPTRNCIFCLQLQPERLLQRAVLSGRTRREGDANHTFHANAEIKKAVRFPSTFLRI